MPELMIDVMKHGLSPRVRGNHGGGRDSSKGLRSIPACAGEPAASFVCVCSQTVYPRVCGGTSARVSTSARVMGLSPRVRGNPVLLSIVD